MKETVNLAALVLPAFTHGNQDQILGAIYRIRARRMGDKKI